MAWSPPALSAGIVWVSAPGDYATFNSNHTPDGTSLRRTKVLLIVQTTGNLKAAQLLLGHTKIESTARYLETELNAALKISEKMEL